MHKLKYLDNISCIRTISEGNQEKNSNKLKSASRDYPVNIRLH